MKRKWMAVLCAAAMLACGGVLPAVAQSGAPVATVDDAMQKKIDAKVSKLLSAAKVEDAAKAAKAKEIVGPWLAKDLISAYLAASFSAEEEFRRRVDKVGAMENEQQADRGSDSNT